MILIIKLFIDIDQINVIAVGVRAAVGAFDCSARKAEIAQMHNSFLNEDTDEGQIKGKGNKATTTCFPLISNLALCAR